MTTKLIRRLRNGRPILEARPENAWESRVVLNPAADLVPIRDGGEIPSSWQLSDSDAQRVEEAGGAVCVLYRAQGAPSQGEDVAPSSLGLAIFTSDFELVKRMDHPVISPEAEFQNLGVEDPRITRIGDQWHMYYTAYSGNPRVAQWDSRRIRICHATSNDLVTWTLNGPIEGPLNDVPNKNAVLLPVASEDGYVLLHRPMKGEYGMTICYADSASPAGPWRDRGVLMKGLDRPECSRSWVGAGGPPIHLGKSRFLMIYHRGSFDHEENREYDLGAALLDFDAAPGESIVRSRIEPIMQPTGPGERVGDPDVGVDNVLFTCANYVYGEDIVIPYAGADSRIFVGSVRRSTIVEALDSSMG